MKSCIKTALKPKELSGNYVPINKVAVCSVEIEVKDTGKNDQDFDDTINSCLAEYTMKILLQKV